MWFVVLGVLLLILKLAEVSPVGGWPWWEVLIPFGLAVLWWAWADATGYTTRKAMQRMDARKAARRTRAMHALGRGGPNSRFPNDSK